MSMSRFVEKVVVITGGASGIGAASARRFHREGARIVVSDLNEAAGRELCAELGQDRAHFYRCDVSVFAEVEKLMAAAVERYGGLDIVFNNAGVGSFARTTELAIEDWQRVIAIDLHGVFYGCKAAIPHLRARRGGVIINTASISGLAGDFGFAAYNAAKGGVINYTRAAAIDHARENIRINAICPGPVATPLVAGIDQIPGLKDRWSDAVPMGRFAQPEEIAAVAAFLASEDASYMTGATLAVDGGLTAHTGQPNLTRIMAGGS